MEMWSWILWISGSVIGLYIITATIFLLLAKISKDDDGYLILDPESWHFKMAFPIARYWESNILKMHLRIGLCRYVMKFVLMLYVGWPIIIIIVVLEMIVFSPIVFLFGFRITFKLEDLKGLDDGPFAVNCKRIQWIPEIRLTKIYPIYLTIPLIYFTLYYFYSEMTLTITIWTGGIIGIIIAVILIVSGIGWIKDTDQHKVSLVRETLKSRARGFCPLMKIKDVERYK